MSADYYVWADVSGWSYQSIVLTDPDGDGVFTADINFNDKFHWTAYNFLISKSSSSKADDQALWVNSEGDWGLLANNTCTLSDTKTTDKCLTYPVKNDGYSTYGIRLYFTASTKTLVVKRLVGISTKDDSWPWATDIYLEETSHKGNVFTGNISLSSSNEFKILSNENGELKFRGYKKWDSVEYLSYDDGNTAITVSDDGVYTITADYTDCLYDAPTRVTKTASVGTYGMATLCSEYALDFTGITDVKAYTITANDYTNGSLTKSQVTGKVKAGTGLYIEGAANASVAVPTTIYSTSAGTNYLKGVTNNTPISQTSGDYTNYILTVNTVSGNVGIPKFYKVNGTSGNTVLAGKAYLQIPTAEASRESFWFGDETTAIETVKQQKFDGKVFNLAGQRIAQPTKGLYIVNGKKVSVK